MGKEFITYEWNEKLVLGIDVVDEQHKGFFDLTQNFINMFDKDDHKELSVEALNFLEEYAQKHFLTEEFYFKKYGYPEMKTHIQYHRTFINKIEDFKSRYREKGLNKDAALELRAFLLNWINAHIIYVDSKYAKHLREFLQKKVIK